MRNLLKSDPLAWAIEPILEESSLVQKSMFGALAYYLHGRLKLVCVEKLEPWRGVLVATEKQYHASLQKSFPSLEPHTVLGKWLYLSESCDDFDEVMRNLCNLVLEDDARIGVIAKPKKRRKKA